MKVALLCLLFGDLQVRLSRDVVEISRYQRQASDYGTVVHQEETSIEISIMRNKFLMATLSSVGIVHKDDEFMIPLRESSIC